MGLKRKTYFQIVTHPMYSIFIFKKIAQHAENQHVAQFKTTLYFPLLA